MATSDKPPIMDLAVQGWRYAFAALSRMPGVLGVAMAIVLVASAITLMLVPDSKEAPSLFAQLLGLLVGVVQGFFLTPVAIAVHRFVLLGEVTQSYALNPSEPRFKQFFVWTVIYQLMVSAPSLLLAGPAENVAATALSIPLFIIVIIAALRLIILFPAIAVDAPGTAWQNAVEDTKGHAWRIFWIVVLVSLPMLAVLLPASLLLGWPRQTGLVAGLVFAALQSVVSVLAICAYAAVASLLFAAFSNRLNVPFSRPQIPQPPPRL